MKKLTAVLLSCTLMCGALPVMTTAAPAAELTANAEDCVTVDHITYVLGDGYASVLSFDNDPSVASIELPKQVEHQDVAFIGAGAFAGASNLKSIKLSEKVTTINEWAFHGCTALEEIVLPEKLEFIGAYAFADCISLEELNIPNNVRELEENAIYGCDHLTELVLPSGISTVKTNVISKCSSLEKVIIKNGPTLIATSAFYDCPKLKTLEIPASIRSMSYSESDTEVSTCYGNAPIKTVYYTGSSVNWNGIAGAEDNFGSINVHFGKKAPTIESRFSICDINRDGQVNAADASEVLGYYAYLSTGGTGSYEEYKAL